MSLKIKSITEAYSMQPETLSIRTEREKKRFNPTSKDCEYIQKEGIDTIYYIGYNFEHKMLFKYLANSVNVHYEI